jgi:hypothetical protein
VTTPPKEPATAPAPAAPRLETPRPPATPPPAVEASWIMERISALAKATSFVESLEAHRAAEEQSLRAQLSRAREHAESALGDDPQNIWKQTLSALDEIETKLIDPLFARGAGETGLKTFIKKLTGEKNAAPPANDERKERWQKIDQTELANRTEAAAAEQTERVRRTTKLRELLRGYTTIAH